MSGTLAIPFDFTNEQTDTIAHFMQNWFAIRDYVNPREVTFGLLANRPAAGTRGTFYFATDTATLYGDDGAAWQTVGLGQAKAAEVLTGLGLANNAGDATNDIDIAIGAATSDDAVIANRIQMTLVAAMTKELDVAWAVGSNTGMRASGAGIANTTYHIFLIQRPDTGVVDIAADTSATGANIAANTNVAYTKKRIIGSILREAGAIVGFVQYGDEFYRKATVLDVNAANPGTAAVTRALSVPLGIQVQAIVNAMVLNTSNPDVTLYLSSLDVNDEAAATAAAPLATVGSVVNAASNHPGGQARVWTDTAAQIRTRLGGTSGAGDTIRVATLGWVHRRGRG